MANHKTLIILVWGFACGLFTGVVFTGLVSHHLVHPEKRAVFSDKAP